MHSRLSADIWLPDSHAPRSLQRAAYIALYPQNSHDDTGKYNLHVKVIEKSHIIIFGLKSYSN